MGMKRLRPVYQVAIIVDSLLVLLLVVVVALQPRYQGLLPLAGVLAGLNAMLHSRTLEELKPVMKRALLVGGLAATVFMAIVAIVRAL